MSKNYWAERFELLEQAQNRQGLECYEEIEKQYRRAQREIESKLNSWYGRLAVNNGITMQEARKLLSGRELEEFKWDVEDYIRYGKENALNGQWMKQLENASARFHISRLEAMKLQLQQSLEVMFGNQLDSIDTTMRGIYTSGYLHTAFEIQRGLGVGWNFSTLDERQISMVIKQPWAADGRNFSQRIWGNREKLVKELNTELTRNIILGQDPQKAIDAIARKMKVSKTAAGRLVMTEQAFFSSAAQRDCFKELDVEEYEIVATLDSRTSEICQEMDGKHFPMSQWEFGVTAPPFHVYCRTTTIPYFEDDFDVAGERAARDDDGKTYYVPADTTYKEWKSSFVDGEPSEKFKLLSDADSESELGIFKRKIIDDEGMEKEYYSTLKDKFSHGSDDAKRVFNKYVEDDSVVEYDFEGTAYYKNGKIHMHYGVDSNNPRGVGATWFHEHGHMIDELAGDASNNERFINALNDDFLDNLSKKSYSEIEKELVDMRTQSAVSDLFNGLSKDKINGVAIHPLRHDGSSYWTDETIRQESFAHMFECQFDELRYKEMQKYFPSALAEFERILKGL